MKQDKWEKLISMPDNYQPDPALIEEPPRELPRKRVKKRAVIRRWKPMIAGTLIFGLGMGAFIPFYRSIQENGFLFEKVYHGTNSIVYEDIENLTEFLSEKNLDIHYYTGEMVTAKSAAIQETGELAIIQQDMFYIDMEQGYFDNISLNILLKVDDEFEILKPFDDLDLTTAVNDISVSYTINDTVNGKVILAKFTYEEVPYFLQITTADETGKIEQYIDLLIS